MKTTGFRIPNGQLVRRLLGIFTPTPPARPSALPAEAPSASAWSKTILIVDDDAVVLKTTSLKLQAQGYRAITARDGSDAIKAVRTEKPDLILLDLSFPPDVAHGGTVPWDGFLIMSWLRRAEHARHIPVIIITGGDPGRYKERSLASGAIAFFHKPIDHEGLLPVIRRATGEEPSPPHPTWDGNFQICV